MTKHPWTLLLTAILLTAIPAGRTWAQYQADEPAGSEEAASEETADEQAAGEEKEKERMTAGTFSGLKLRCIGPALTSGRIVDFAVNPDNHAHYYVAVASGGVWKTLNAGTTWQPIFDSQPVFSIGCVEIDPNNPHVVWVGTGENNSQRSVAFGDGVYRSRDGGKNWTNVGLKESEHIGMIAIDPRDSNVVYVAAQGPLWRAGGDRGLYKTTDGGETWHRILFISEDTGVNEVHMDPRNPDVLYASAHQRRRRVWTQIGGGPESGLYKSTDAGETWRKINSGLPGGDKGRIGLDISPANPDIIYAIVQAQRGSEGFYRSTDRGETWVKRNSYMTTSGQYYNEVICDPKDPDRAYVMDTVMHVTNDGGKTFSRVPRRYKHVDNHALWIDPDNTDHLLAGCDGGIYESWDLAANWQFKPNLPVTQFYRVSVDNSLPFYYVYGGTQDNNTLGGPSRTKASGGIANEDWFITTGGDGYETRIDPEDPNILYSLSQYGGLVRHDRRSGEVITIKPRELPGEDANRWNWDTPLIISPHLHCRLYVASQRLYRSDDYGNSWRAISGDLSRQVDRNTLEVMGKIQKVDAVAKHESTSPFGNCVSLAESPIVEGLIYVGTDDGLVQVTEDGGGHWRKVGEFPGVLEMTYVSCLTASKHDADTVFAAFDNHKNGDFKPYILKSVDRGHTWESIAGDLPERDIVYSIAQDHLEPDLMFAGAEFGVYFTADGGGKWIRLKGGIPTIAVRDIDIQERENDLALATFGRGFYILDDYTPLRLASEEFFKNEAAIFPVKDALQYIQTSRMRGSGRGSQGASFFMAPNPPYGAIFTYYIKDKLTTLRERRKEAEKEAEKEGQVPPYPTFEDLRAEQEDRQPQVMLTIRNAMGDVVRRINGSRSSGIHRTSWDLRLAGSGTINVGSNPSGPLALPGTYTVTLSSEYQGEVRTLAGPMEFDVIPLDLATFAAEDKDAVLAFYEKVARLQRAMDGTLRIAEDARSRIAHIRQAVINTPAADEALHAEIHSLEGRLNDLLAELRGDRLPQRGEDPDKPSLRSRLWHAISGQGGVTSAPTQTQQDAYAFASEGFTKVHAALKQLIETDLVALEEKLEAIGAPWTPGRRIPDWTRED